jgi:hypothetical protein
LSHILWLQSRQASVRTARFSRGSRSPLLPKAPPRVIREDVGARGRTIPGAKGSCFFTSEKATFLLRYDKVRFLLLTAAFKGPRITRQIPQPGNQLSFIGIPRRLAIEACFAGLRCLDASEDATKKKGASGMVAFRNFHGLALNSVTVACDGWCDCRCGCDCECNCACTCSCEPFFSYQATNDDYKDGGQADHHLIVVFGGEDIAVSVTPWTPDIN